ncbi:MAG: acylphosphatase [Gammaproteobacteria bacterium]
MNDAVCVRCLVSGRVQGVFFRASTAREAKALGVNGHAINLADGRVEVLICGKAAAVETLCRWLETGPPGARVDSVKITDADLAGAEPTGFVTG